jgi:hypothetical protein
MAALTLRLDEVVYDLLDIIEEKGGDYTYTQFCAGICQYFHDEEPGCIVGHLLAKHGITQAFLESKDGPNVFELNASDVTELVDRDVLGVDNKTRAFLFNLQSKQDKGVTWGEAMKFAIDRLEEV